MRVYHYTSLEAYNKINQTKFIIPSTPWTSSDYSYGSGWYFTDIPPTECDMKISWKCWINSLLHKVKYYFEFEIDGRFLTKTRENVYMIKENVITGNTINITQTYYSNSAPVLWLTNQGRKNICTIGNCLTCLVGKVHQKR